MVRLKRARWIVALPALVLGAVACYSTGDGRPPPVDKFYYPVGLAVSPGGNVLYAANSDFDLQYNGGTIQSYDLRLIRRDAVALIEDPAQASSPNLPSGARVLRPSISSDPSQHACPGNPPVLKDSPPGGRQPLGETCAPPIDSTFYFRKFAIIGAFATDLLLSPPPADLAGGPAPAGKRGVDRLFMPVRGSASLTWASVVRDGVDETAPPDGNFKPFEIACDQDSEGRCGRSHLAGIDSNEPGNTRHITMPGEPFGMAMSEDGTSIVITHQNETKTSLFTTGLSRADDRDDPPFPSLQFILDGVPIGGVGVAAVPHDPLASATQRAAFLQTSRSVAEVDLLRHFTDDGSSLNRPFLNRESVYPIAVAAGGTDSRGIVIDPTPRLACKGRVQDSDPDRDRKLAECARRPARVFIASRSPAALLVGEIGGGTLNDQAYDPDRLVLNASVPLSAGPSNLYLAPIVDQDGTLALRVFAVCFDSATIFVYDPDTNMVENVIPVGPGPFAMAFDPFSMTDVAMHLPVAPDKHESNARLPRYRFAYLASFTQSFVQLIDLYNKDSQPTFENVVFTLGEPTNPKGS